MKFSIIGRSHLSKSLSDLAKPHFSARFSVEYLRPEVRGVLVVVAAGEGIHSEIVRVNLAGCLKLAALRAVVYVFNREAAEQRQVAEEEEKVIFVMPVMTDEEVGTTFDGKLFA